MKSVRFQVKERLNHEVLKVTVRLSSAFGLSAHTTLSVASTRLARQKNLAEHKYLGYALSAAVVFSQAQRMTGAKLKSTNSC